MSWNGRDSISEPGGRIVTLQVLIMLYSNSNFFSDVSLLYCSVVKISKELEKSLKAQVLCRVTEEESKANYDVRRVGPASNLHPSSPPSFRYSIVFFLAYVFR